VLLKKRVAIKEFFVKDFCNRDEKTSFVSVGTLSKRALVDKLKGKFIDEARSLSELVHPNIVHVSDVFEENGTAYYVMDYIDGKSLSEMVKADGPMPEARALKYIRQTAAALQFVHEHNRLHLDVKPANVMIDSHDNAILIDFGASKQYDEEAGENTSTLMGKTPGYAPIEQMGNNVVRFMAATDVYALGATLYKLLTGVTPLNANLRASGEELEPLPEHISEATRVAVTEAMRIRKRERPQSVTEFLALLDGKPVNKEDVKPSIKEEKEEAPVEPSEETKFDVPPAYNGTNDSDNIDDVDSDISQRPKPSTFTSGLPTMGTLDVKKKKQGGKKNLMWLYIAIAVVIVASLTVIFVVEGNKDNKGGDVQDTAKAEDITPGVLTAKIAFTASNGVKFEYDGEVSLNEKGDTVPQGKGVGKYSDGKYEGEYRKGLRHGKGEYKTSDGMNTFTGTFKDDMYDEGKLITGDKSYYEGTFMKDEPWNGKWYNADNTLYCVVKDGKAKL